MKEQEKPGQPEISPVILHLLGMEDTDRRLDPRAIEEREKIHKARLAGRQTYEEAKAQLGDSHDEKPVYLRVADEYITVRVRHISILPFEVKKELIREKGFKAYDDPVNRKVMENWAISFAAAALEDSDVRTAFSALHIATRDILGDIECIELLREAAQKDKIVGMEIAVKLQKLKDEKDKARNTPFRRLGRALHIAQ